MYCEILNDEGQINSTLFIKYDGTGIEPEKLDEFVLEWNKDFKMDKTDNDKDVHNQPIRVSYNERWKRVINPLQVRLELLKEQEEDMVSRPFIGIKS